MSKANKKQQTKPSNEGFFVSGMVADVFGSDQWLITEQGCNQLNAVAELLSKGTPTADARRSPGSQNKAIIPVVGPLARADNWISEIMGWSTTEGVQAAVSALDQDVSVSQIIMYYDTPGGVVQGLPECADVIFECATPIVAFTSGSCASAGYWLASQCDGIYTGRLGALGSIGVRSYYYKADSGDVVSRNAPNKLPSKSQLQAMVDEVETIFIETVARGRGIDEKDVIANYGQGSMMFGEAAVKAGLADEITTLDELLAGTVGMPPVRSTISTSDKGEPMKTDNQPGGIATADHEKAVSEAKTAGFNEGKAEGEKASAQSAVDAERERVTAILQAGEGKPEKQVRTLISKGVDAETAKAILDDAPDVKKDSKLESQMRDSNPDITNDDSPDDDDEDTSASVWDKKGDK